MKKSALNLRIVLGVGLLGVTLFFAAHQANSALIDWTKHEEWRRKQLEALVTEVRLSGSAPYVIMSFRQYDTNNDGLIDRVEVEAVKDFLHQQFAKKSKL